MKDEKNHFEVARGLLLLGSGDDLIVGFDQGLPPFSCRKFGTPTIAGLPTLLCRHSENDRLAPSSDDAQDLQEVL